MRKRAIVTTASGNEVAAATNSVPDEGLVQPMASAKPCPRTANQMPAATTTAAAPAYRHEACRKVMCG